MESLTKREKILIYVLVCFLLVVAGWFLLITPALEKNTLLNAQNVNLQSQILTLKKTLKDYESAPAELKIIEESYDKIADQYNSVMSNDDIDKLLTTKILANGFKPVSLTIGTMTDATFKTEETKSSSQTKEATKNKVSVIKQVNVIASISGNFSNLNKLLDAINNQKGLEIGNLTYQVSSNEKNTISISFIVYMVQK